MAEKISVQIALDGGQEVARQLEGIGEAGQKAFSDISKAAEQVGGFKQLDPEAVTEKLKQLGIEGTDAFAKIQKAVQTASRFEALVTGVQSIESAFVALGRAAGPVGLAIAAGIKAATAATIAFADALNKASDQAVKLGLSLEQLKKQTKDLERLGVFGQAGAEGLQKMNQAAAQSKLGEVAKAARELKEADAAGFGARGTQQLLLLQQAARGVGPEAKAARQALVELGQPIPTGAPKTLAELGGDLAAFRAQLQGMPDTLDRTNLAIESMGGAAGTALIQGLRAAEGSMSSAELKAYNLQQSLERLASTAQGFSSVAFAPAITAGVDTVNASVQNLFTRLQQNPWGVFAQGAQAALSPISALLQPIAGAILDLGVKLTGIAWGTISSAATTAFNAIVQAIQGAGSAIANFVSSLGGITWDVISSAGVAAWNAITGAINTAIDAIRRFLGLQSQSGAGGGAGGQARGGLIGGRGSGTSDSNLAWLSRGEFVIRAAAVRQFGTGFFAALNAGRLPGFALGGIVGGGGTTNATVNVGQMAAAIDKNSEAIASQSEVIRGLANNINQLAQKIDGLARKIDGLASALDKVLETVKDMALSTIEEVKRLSANTLEAMAQMMNALEGRLDRQAQQAQKEQQARSRTRDTGGTGTDIEKVIPEQPFRDIEDRELKRRLFGFAPGGLMGGRGSGTSDSNLAWLSRGEFVIRAAAVRKFGATFFAALNAGMIPGFALGGLVPRPAFAGGGSVGGMSHVTIAFPGVPPVSGLRASSAVVEELHRSAALAQVRSGGRKPSRYS